ncbi:Patulin synthase [Cladobotryum mycophilum]|uniref:Patulin synthase n=1 Tax=Cladobotryum mycophilum TaxID=491253 RepID=A0ABR0SIA3_9HYPO
MLGNLVAAGLLLFAPFCLATPASNGFLKDKLLAPLLEDVSSLVHDTGIVEGVLGTLEGILDIDQEFDYVVVGGGTGGNAIGVRLAEAGFRVAIVEAGTFHELSRPLISVVPATDSFAVGSSKGSSLFTSDWILETEPQPGANNRKIHFAQGKCLGGTSALNFMVHHRPSTETMDRWANVVGDESYKLESFLEFYKKSVSFTSPNTEKRRANASTPYDPNDFAPSGQGGPVQVGYTNWVSVWSTWLEQGLKAVGLKRTMGFDRGELLGYHYLQATIRSSDQTRSSSSQYIYEAKRKALKLKVFTLTQAKRILFDSNKKAIGVVVSSLGIDYTLKATKEVIVSAGAFHSPQLLMVSGVGPSDTLERFNIPAVSVLPGVGQNMWDHILFGNAFEVNFPTFDAVTKNLVTLALVLAEYITFHDGPATSNEIEFLGWEKIPEHHRNEFTSSTKKQLDEFPADWPEVEYLGLNAFSGDLSYPLLIQPRDGKQYATIMGALVAPLSRGNVTINSASMFDKPVINPNWLSSKGDQEVAVALLKRMREVWNTKELRSIRIGNEYWPGKDVVTDEQILDFIRNTMMTVWHPSCTCKMGKKDDLMAVVDAAARVYGVKGLRVVDASAFPLLPPGHPQSTIYALAEKIAHNIIHGN